MDDYDVLIEDFLANIVTVPHFKKVFANETDRGCVLLAGSLLDNELEKMLAKYFVRNNKIHKKLFSVNGPIGTLSAKIDLSYAMGLISKKDFNRLHLIREIRNDFGHSFKSLNFHDTKVSQKIRSIALDNHTNKHKIRNVFIDVINQLLIGFYVQIYVARKTEELEHSEMVPKDLIIKYKLELRKNKERNRSKDVVLKPRST